MLKITTGGKFFTTCCTRGQILRPPESPLLAPPASRACAILRAGAHVGGESRGVGRCSLGFCAGPERSCQQSGSGRASGETCVWGAGGVANRGGAALRA